MTQRISKPTHLKPISQLTRESLYIGIDIGTSKHVAGFISKTLLLRYLRFEGVLPLSKCQLPNRPLRRYTGPKTSHINRGGAALGYGG